MTKKIVCWTLGLLSLAYIGFCAAVYFYPQAFFYNPTSVKPDVEQARSDGFRAWEVKYKALDGTELYGWVVRPKVKGKKMIVFYHGNSYNIAKFYNKLKPLTAQGYGVFIGEYRGFGGIEGKITQQNLEMDAKAAIDYLHSLGYHNHQLVLYGMSLGSHMASYIAGNDKKGKFAGLILEVPFDSLLNVVKQRVWPLFPFKYLIKDQYDNIPFIQSLNIPLLIMVAQNDKTVPPKRAEALFEEANQPKKIITYEGAEHSNLFDFDNWKDILLWLKRL